MNPSSRTFDHPTLEPGYKQELAMRLMDALVAGPLAFQAVVKAAEGAYPSDVLMTLHQLETEHHVHLDSTDSWVLCDSSLSSPGTRPPALNVPRRISDGLPEPHPLDFDWRFTPETIADLRMRIGLSTTESVAILGAPTLYKYLIDSGSNAWLFDKNPHVVQHLRDHGYTSVTECDLLRFSMHPEQFKWAMADPPWYLEYYQAFLDVAKKILSPEGKLFLSALPRLTRPSAPMDRFHILDYAARQGFDLIEVNPGVLHYASPPFEIEALRAEGLIVGDWRSGDLFSFVMRSHAIQRLERSTQDSQEQWRAVQLGKTTIKIKVESQVPVEPFNYYPVSPSGDVRLRSVSRRSPVRSSINLWTSRNIALRISKPIVLTEILLKIAEGNSTLAALGSTADKYQLSEDEVTKLQEVMKLLITDAGLTWNK